MIPLFTWQGIESSGASLQGEIRAPNACFVEAQLIALGIQPTKIRRFFFALLRKRILDSKRRIQFSEQLSGLLAAGISIMLALTIIEKIFTDRRIKTLFWILKQRIELGQSFGQALKNFPQEFSSHYQQMIVVGETTGQLEKMLLWLAELEKKQSLLKNKLKKASFYPIFTLFVALSITGFLVIEVVPEFAEIFTQAKISLPPATVLLVNISNFLITYGLFISIFLSLIISSFIYFFKAYKSIQKITLQKFLLIPYIGKLIQSFSLSHFTYALATLLKVGISLTSAIEILSNNTKNPLYTEHLAKILEKITQGDSLSEALTSSFLFPHFIVYTVKIGEKSGLISQSLFKIADFYESEIDRFVDGIGIFLEPVLMLILGLIIGIFMIALYLPIFSFGNAVA